MLQEILKVTLYKGNRYINTLFCAVFITDSVSHLSISINNKNLFFYHNLYTLFVFSGHQEILRQEGKCQLYDPAPLVLVKDIMTYMPQIKYMFSNLASEQQPPSKRQKV